MFYNKLTNANLVRKYKSILSDENIKFLLWDTIKANKLCTECSNYVKDRRKDSCIIHKISTLVWKCANKPTHYASKYSMLRICPCAHFFNTHLVLRAVKNANAKPKDKYMHYDNLLRQVRIMTRLKAHE